MRLKHTSVFAAALALSACPDDEPSVDGGENLATVEVAGPATQPYGLIDDDTAVEGALVAEPTSANGWTRMRGTSLGGRFTRSTVTDDGTWLVGGRELFARYADEGELEGLVFNAGGYLHGVGATGSELWLVGEGSQVFRFDGEALTRIATRSQGWSYTLFNAYLPRSGRAFIVGEEQTGYGILLSYKDGEWGAHLYEDSYVLEAVDGRNENDVWVVGEGGKIWHWDGAQFGRIDAGTRAWLNDVRVTEDAVWAVGAHGTVVRLDESGATLMEVPGEPLLEAVWTVGGEIFVAGEHMVYRIDDDESVAVMSEPPVALGPVMHGAALLDESVLLIDEPGALWRFNDGAVSPLLDGPQGELRGAAVAGNRLWVVGEAGAWSLDDDAGAWSAAAGALGKGLFATLASDAGVFFAGEGGLIARHDGDKLVDEDSSTEEELRALCALDDGRVFAAGARGTVIERDVEGTWATRVTPTATELYAIAGGFGAVMAAGEGGVVFFDEGEGFTNQSAPTDRRWRGAAIASDGGRWVVGDRGGIYRWTPAIGWQDRSLSVATPMMFVVELADGAMLVGGRDGSLYRVDETGATLEDADTFQHLFGATRDGDSTYVVGSGGIVMRKTAN